MNSTNSKLKIQWSANVILLLACILTSFGGHASSASDLLKQLRLPHAASIELVSDRTVRNGLPMAIAEFKAVQTSEQVLSFYRTLWASDSTEKNPGYYESTTAGWWLISRIKDNHQLVVQLSTERTAGASGFVSVLPLNAAAKTVHSTFFPDLSLLSSNVSVDGADTSNMQVLASPMTNSATHARYLSKLLNEGWQVLVDMEVTEGWVTILSRDRKRLELSFLPSSEYASVLVVHELESK